MSGSSLVTISRCLKEPRSSVKTIIPNYKHNGNVQPSYCSGRSQVLCSRNEHTVVQNVNIKPRTKAKHFVKTLAEADKSEMSPVPTLAERPLSKEEVITPKGT